MRRIMINASLCDGCKNCTVACMQAHRDTPGTVYDLDLTDPETGIVSYDEKKCGSCFMCVMNCPYGVLKADTATHTKVVKCDFCMKDDAKPNCVKSCPKKAIYVEEVSL